MGVGRGEFRTRHRFSEGADAAETDLIKVQRDSPDQDLGLTADLIRFRSEVWEVSRPATLTLESRDSFPDVSCNPVREAPRGAVQGHNRVHLGV